MEARLSIGSRSHASRAPLATYSFILALRRFILSVGDRTSMTKSGQTGAGKLSCCSSVSAFHRLFKIQDASGARLAPFGSSSSLEHHSMTLDPLRVYSKDMKYADRELECMLPLQPAVFHILMALAEDDRHGYAIIQDVAMRTNGRMKLSAGTLYRSIQKML